MKETNSDYKDTLIVIDASFARQRAHLSIFTSCLPWFYKIRLSLFIVQYMFQLLDLLKEGTSRKPDDRRRLLIGAKLKLQMKRFRLGWRAMKYKVARVNL